MAEMKADLDTKELGHRAERLKIIIDTYPKHRQAVQAQADGEVIDNADIKVSAPGGEVAFVIRSNGFKYEGDNCEHWLDLNVLYSR